MSVELAMAAALLGPLAGAVLIALFGRRPNLRDGAMIAASVVTFLAVYRILPAVEAGGRPELFLFDFVPGLGIRFVIEPLGMLFALVASFLWIVTSFYAIGYMRGHHEENQTRFYICFAIAISAALGVAMSGNMLTLFIAYEVLTLSTYPLVTHHQSPESMRAGGPISASCCRPRSGSSWSGSSGPTARPARSTSPRAASSPARSRAGR